MSQAETESRTGASALERLRALLLDGGGLLATLLGPASGSGAESSDGAAGAGDADSAGGIGGPAAIAAAGPRAEGHREEYELLVEAIYEGYLLHYGEPRVLLAPDADLGLLAGDRLYAIGLARLVALGDTDAVAELADTISLSALAHGAEQPELAGAVWAAGARAVGWGAGDRHARAKEMVLTGDRGALEAMCTSARAVPESR
jgi:hypothetical protein